MGTGWASKTARALLVLGSLAAVVGLAACTTGPRDPVTAPVNPRQSATTGPAAAPSPVGSTAAGSASQLPRPDHVLVAVFENKSFADIVGNPKAPYLNGLLGRAAVFTNAHAVAHPSQPNYLALFSGSTHGVTDDHCPVRLSGRQNLGRQLLDAGRTFTGYSEDMPGGGYTGCSRAGYARKHNPWVDFDNVPASANQPYTAFPADYGRLPTVSFVVPNLCNDMHDCGIAAGDRWAKSHLDSYLRWADTHNSLLVITFDENDNSAGNQILTLFAGPMVRPGRYDEAVTHYTVLRTIEDLYGLPPVGEASRAAPVADAWR